MFTRRELTGILYGMWRTVRCRPDAATYLDTSNTGVVKSFLAMLLSLPVFALQSAIIFTNAGRDLVPVRYFTLETLFYVIGWLVWPVLMVHISRGLNAFSHFFAYITAYNWLRLAEGIVLFPLFALAAFLLGSGSEGPVFLLAFAVLVFFTVCKWALAKHTLEIAGSAAALVVVVDIITRLVLNDLLVYMLRSP